MPRLSPISVSALLLAGALALACKDSKKDEGTPTPPVCTLAQLGQACTTGGDCCSGSCANSICIVESCAAKDASCALASECCTGACNGISCKDPTECKALETTCGDPSECCSGVCTNGKCARDDQGCFVLGAACTVAGDCCTNTCTSSKCEEATTAYCRDPGLACTSDSQCCSGACDGTGHCWNPGGQCEYPGERCTTDSDCCSQNCLSGGTCSGTTCRQTAQSCTDAGQCCSGICTGGTCQPLPAGTTGQTCKTLGEACTLATDCCSTNCQGGACKPAASCNAFGDVCTRPEDCCSGLCAQSAAGQPGRCNDDPGGCGLDGYPCASDSNCCTKKCVDLGTGATVCQPSGGCRMTGNFCDRTASCCGGTNEADPSLQSTYGVFCDSAGTSPGATEWDDRTQDARTCTGGQSCNPPGNICGYKASQNCCYDGGGSGKAVCKPDENNILRCFGGPVTTECPTGWDGNDPDCCKPAGDVCQFRDQCCGMAPCVPDSSGVLRCAATSCLPQGATCSTGGAPAVDPCCEDTTCRDIPELGWACTPTSGICSRQGQACGGPNPDCCFGTCNGGTCGEACLANDTACTTNSQCCSGTCNGNVCVPPCQAETASCTFDADCCDGLTCDIPSGATSGTCKSGDISTCALTGNSCLLDPCCNAGDTCTAGVCTPPQPPPTCSGVAGGCSSDANCCQTPEALKCYTTDAFEQLQPCGAGSVACFCDVPPAACVPLNQPCTSANTCCNSGVCIQTSTNGACTSSNPADCTCKPVG